MILLLCGGGGSEHEVSLKSADYIESKLKLTSHKYIRLTLLKNFQMIDNEKHSYVFQHSSNLVSEFTNVSNKITYIIPCIHGTPGEDGKIQAYFDLLKIPYMGPGQEASLMSFNKITTKMWAKSIGINTAPFEVITNTNSINFEKAEVFFNQHKDIYVKATHQGSSIGVYHVTDFSELKEKIIKAIELSPYVLLEKTIKGRELEVIVFEYKKELISTGPAEILLTGENFYTFEEKYGQTSHATVEINAPGIPDETKLKLQAHSKAIFKALKLKDLSRIDFFLEGETIYLNEINTFPGHTNISVFPRLLESTGIKYVDYLNDLINEDK